MLKLKSVKICGVTIFRPTPQMENLVYTFIKDNLFKLFQSGNYTDIDTVVKIVKTKYSLYNELLDLNLAKIDKKIFLNFLIEQYEYYGQVQDLFNKCKLNPQEEEDWKSYATNSRRGIKYLLEILLISGIDNSEKLANENDQIDAYSIIFIASEELVSLYMTSGLYDKDFIEEINLNLDETKNEYFDVTQNKLLDYDIRFLKKISPKYFPNEYFLNDYNLHSEILKNGFLEDLGIEYKEIIKFIFNIITHGSYDDLATPRVINREKIINLLTFEHKISTDQAERIIDGFSITAEKMQIEGRKLFQPKQEYRARKRAFFLVPNEYGDELYFSRRMALENIGLLMNDVPFRKIPREWYSDVIKKDLDKLSLEAGKNFEKVVTENFEKVNITGITNIKKIYLKNGYSIKIPDHVGEIDFLGLSSENKMLIIAEFKQVGYSTEPRLYKDDFDKFIKRNKNYTQKFEKKINWVFENHELIKEYLFEQLSINITIESIGYTMITHYPMFIERYIKNFSCLCIADFMNRYEESEKKWTLTKKVII